MNEPENDYPTIPEDRGEDLINQELAPEADLVLFMAGNQFMAMPELLEAFQREYPEVRKIFCETLPPRLELEQILAGGAWYRGELLQVVPDVYSSVSREGVDLLQDKGMVRPEETFVYLHNRIALMVRAGNPKGLRRVQDLAYDEITISQPNPRFEDIAGHILNMYRQVGGEDLVETIMQRKVRAGTTLLTVVHHRETPQRLIRGRVDVGPVWATEVVHALAQGLPLEGIDLPEEIDQRDKVEYWMCRIRKGNNPENARLFLAFVKTPQAQKIFERHGFTPAFKA